MKGIVLAGGTGSRLWPVTEVVSKQLLPIYDKPLIYYPISTLMLAGVRDILIIATPKDLPLFERLLGDGSRFGLSFNFEKQPEPKGIAEALIIGETFLSQESCLMILGDNIFHGVGLGNQLEREVHEKGAHVYTYTVNNPKDYGVLFVNEFGEPVAIEEKPNNPQSNLAVTGLYYFDGRASKFAKSIAPSKRGELEITSVLNYYLQNKELSHTQLPRGTAWLDTGTHTSMQDASTYVRIIEERTGQKMACLEEIAFTKGWITTSKYEEIAKSYLPSTYGNYLLSRITPN